VDEVALNDLVLLVLVLPGQVLEPEQRFQPRSPPRAVVIEHSVIEHGAKVDPSRAPTEIARRGYGSPTNVGINATQLTGSVLKAEAAIVILGRLGGPPLLEVLSLLGKGRLASTPLHEFVADVTRSIAAVRQLIETEQSFGPPAGA
jgi:hypothetical protein